MNNWLFVTLFCLLVSAFSSAQPSNVYSYCVPVEKIDFNPFREVIDGKALAYLMMLRSYISTDESEQGILAKFEFSPDGKTFIGQISKNLKWSNGTAITAKEAAFGIAKTLQFRPLGKRVKIAGTEKMNQPGWSKLSYENIKFIDERTFKITFESDIENLTGVMREALSTNSRHNRFWPIKFENDDLGTETEVIFKFPFVKINGSPGMEIEGKKIAFTNSKDCLQPVFSMFPEMFDSLNGLLMMKSHSASAVLALPNTNRLTLKEREELVAWIRSTFKGLSEVYGVREVDGFFLAGESGFNSQIKWPTSSAVRRIKKKKIVIGAEIPIYKKFIEDAAKKANLNFEVIHSPSDRTDVDANVVASGLIEGRYVFLQDANKWKYVTEFLRNAKKTKKNLQLIAEMSASTLPPDLLTLTAFEKDALSEYSIAPVARRYPAAFSQPNLGLCLAWTLKGELSFFIKEKCFQK